MKKFVTKIFLISLLSTSLFAQAQNSNSADVCRGDFSDSIVDSIGKCSDSELNRSYAEIKALEDAVTQDQKSLAELKRRSGENKVSYNQVVFAETHYSTAAWLSVGVGAISGAGYIMHGLTEGGKLFPRASAVLKGSGIALIMSVATGAASKYEKSRLELEFSEIPKLEKSMQSMKAEIELRKKALEIAIKLKQIKKT